MGDLTIETDRLILRNGGQANATIWGRRIGTEGGRLIVRASDIELPGTSTIPGRTGIQPSALQTRVEPGGIGNAGDLIIDADRLSISDGARVAADTNSMGNAGRIIIDAADSISLSNGSILATVNRRTIGQGGNIDIRTGLLQLDNRSQISSSTLGRGNTGEIVVRATDGIILDDRSQITSIVGRGAIGDSQNITIHTPILELNNRSQVSAATSGRGNAGDIFVENTQLVELADNSSISTAVNGGATGQGGNIEIETDSLNLDDRSRITASTAGQRRAGNITVMATDLNLTDRSSILAESTDTGEAGDITVNAGELLNMTDSEIRTSAAQSSGGAITVNAKNADIQLFGTSGITTSVDTGVGDGGSIAVTANTIQLHDDSDIRTSVEGGQGDGGNITLRASSIVTFDDSDIIAATPEGQGGDTTFDTNAFFAEDFDLDAAYANPDDLEDNDRTDVNATGTQPGTITTPDTSFIQNSLSDLPESAIDPDNLVANSCVVRSQEQGSTFIITEAEGLPQRPGDATFPTYPTGEVRSVPDETESENQQSWKMGDPIVEPQGVYQLPDEQLVLSRECPEEGR